MKAKANQPTASRDSRELTKQEEEAKEAFMKYHPHETNPSLKVDDDYKKNIEKLLGIKIK